MQTMSGTNRNVENVRNNFLPIGAKLRFANHPTTTKDDRSANIEGSIYRPPHGLGNMLRMCFCLPHVSGELKMPSIRSIES